MVNSGMKLNEIKDPKKETPALLRPQAGPKLSNYDKAVIKNKLKKGYVPSFLKKQAE